MKARAKELETPADQSAGETAVLAAIEEMSEQDPEIATNFYQIVHEAAPELVRRTWYGMPAYAIPGTSRKVIYFFQGAAKMKTRYNTVGFSDTAALDDGSIWPTGGDDAVELCGTPAGRLRAPAAGDRRCAMALGAGVGGAGHCLGR